MMLTIAADSTSGRHDGLGEIEMPILIVLWFRSPMDEPLEPCARRYGEESKNGRWIDQDLSSSTTPTS
jgi:hypothetical protein